MCLLAGRQTGISLETGQQPRRSPRGSRGLPGVICNASILGLKDIIVTAGISMPYVILTQIHIYRLLCRETVSCCEDGIYRHFSSFNFQSNQSTLPVHSVCGMIDTSRSLLIAPAG